MHMLNAQAACNLRAIHENLCSANKRDPHKGGFSYLVHAIMGRKNLEGGLERA